MSLRPAIFRLALPFAGKRLGRRAIASSCAIVENKLPQNIPPPSSLNYLQAPTSQQNLIIGPNLHKSSILSILDDVSRIGPILDGPTRLPATITPVPASRPAPVQDPSVVIEKLAARLIVIRRRKMRRHKLKKLRIKMKYEWAKVRQKRELRKEKAFQAELMSRIREAEKFDAAAYVANKLNKANEILIPKRWKGKRLPEFVIKELLEERNMFRQLRQEKIERRKNMVTKVADYKV